MTELGAMNTLELNRPFADIEMQSAIDMAISALEEVQQYRAIGTVEGYERAIQISIENYNLYREYKAKVQEFEAIGTVSEFRELKEKATPKKPFGEPSGWACPNCGEFHAENQSHCTECNQAILWT